MKRFWLILLLLLIVGCDPIKKFEGSWGRIGRYSNITTRKTLTPEGLVRAFRRNNPDIPWNDEEVFNIVLKNSPDIKNVLTDTTYKSNFNDCFKIYKISGNYFFQNIRCTTGEPFSIKPKKLFKEDDYTLYFKNSNNKRNYIYHIDSNRLGYRTINRVYERLKQIKKGQ